MGIWIKRQEIRFCVTAFIWGILFAFLIPFWQVPDEYAHAEMIGQEIKNEKLGALLLEEAPMDEHRVRWDTDEKVDLETLEDTIWKTPQYNRADCLLRGVSIKIVRHLPAVIGIQIAVLFRVPVYWVLFLGRLSSLLFYIIVCNVALKHMPVQKELLELVMLLPMCIQEAASLSYDAVLLPLCFWVFSYALYLKFEASWFGLREILMIIGVLLCIALIKIPYVVLGGAFLIVPPQKVRIAIGKIVITGEHIVKFRWQIGMFVTVAGAVGLYCMRDNIWVKLVVATLTNFSRTLWLFGRTCKVWGDDIYQSMIGCFGYFDKPTVSAWFLTLVPALVLVIALTDLKKTDVTAKSLSMKDKVILYLMGGGCFYLVTVSMISFTAGYDTQDWVKAMYEITEIGGLQGRYYIPILMFLLFPLPFIFEMKEKVYKRIRAGYYVLACTYTCSAVAARYWPI